MTALPKLGIDIGTASIKLVELFPVGKGKWKLGAIGSEITPPGGVLGNQNNLGVIAAAVGKTVKESGAKNRRVAAALPEEQVSSHVVEIPLMSDEEVKQALQWQVEQYIPIPADKAVWSHEIIRRDEAGGGMEVLLVAAAKNLVDSFVRVFDMAGLEVVALETELMATARAVVPADVPLSMIVDIGAKSTDLGIVRAGQMVFARTIPTAGEAFTRAIEAALGLASGQAEEYKRTYGFDTQKMQGKITEAMKPVMNVITAEVRKTGDFYMSKHRGEQVKLVTLSGGVALVPEVVNVLSGLLGMEVAVGNPFNRIEMDKNKTSQLLGLGPFYAVAAGLAMRTS
ncbi:MAG: Type IV pilus assembly protein PilM [Candidatus Amesbacteria bacterium GW2011_GWA1_47_16]|uniref:SHS2 domain-containing protein n=5 Tax=Candidatus Amesiibacteriota TaxID=1752730 RepID=A0A1F4ZTX6_9BACT|nr:MAG: Type IV pilus assembly protein PilM [Candidatus Amesbacteria bacterium GW2011_GWA1_47_16]KKU64652.1 MAG: Type IV pilus assembly protein PilM [Candidatus Amesbacteria bacterium GW2011_GWC1_47_15]KKU96579.1 MAG: Type IV pilus assembly protein PilM [Candidatus Amesbacteria bacterium GW2011_GWB1_48_13]OGD01714.1 MAG: hypothetical protein A2972_00280 [Candidatus Amesbacteria bacterium RIFCSPLOWO2_01_FULL_47_33]OGD09883.1 MAG: hypothetical protein A2395_01375 [Candidatus Amesbacteria bacteriu